MQTEEKLEALLEAWEESYRKGQLTLWIFLALSDGRKYADQIREFVERASGGTMRCEEQTLYRSLRKFEHIGVFTFETGEGNRGPERKYYTLTPLGRELLAQFTQRNIALFFNEEIKKLLGYENNEVFGGVRTDSSPARIGFSGLFKPRHRQ